MYRLRPFRNSDPPALVDIWRAQLPERGFFQRMSLLLLEHFVLSKPYFDRHGLLVAEQDGQLIGFVHAGFGPNADHSDISHEIGIVCMLQWRSDADADLAALRIDLLRAAETYLTQHHVHTIVAGSHPPFNPFYHGLSSGSELAGVLSGDREMHELLVNAGYVAAERFFLMECSLQTLRPTVDRQQRMLTRSYEVRARLDHEFDSWWETCTHGPIQRSAFEVITKIGIQRCGSLIWWSVDLEGMGLVQPAVSLARLEVSEPHRRAGLATFLVSNAMRQLKANGTAKVQLQISQANEAGIRFFRKLGFQEVDQGISYRKAQDP